MGQAQRHSYSHGHAVARKLAAWIIFSIVFTMGAIAASTVWLIVMSLL